ncbi:MAG: hypothetical protein CMI78_00650 [Candidatus Pelagibacter sp.]|nr:hypothetical protein [Candidatus Pelagibacter sp.]OUW68436.1 MAG: hypothetical protein CBD62_01765 [Candidatus Pelagibacter sp. TMED202]|tara:strand:+ start:16119 stop:16631 length:513 start_codon:yes stop_codon:yes gene_type:complete
MKLGKINFLPILFFISLTSLNAEDKILTAPIINLENLEPSYENLENEKDTVSNSNTIIKKRKVINKKKDNIKFVNLIGLDKITAKTIPIKIRLGETAKFGLLEIKALKCGVSDLSKTKNNSVAYIQVRDISENQNEKVFIFNGWTFSSNPSLAPIDHAIYDIWLVSCDSV